MPWRASRRRPSPRPSTPGPTRRARAPRARRSANRSMQRNGRASIPTTQCPGLPWPRRRGPGATAPASTMRCITRPARRDSMPKTRDWRRRFSTTCRPAKQTCSAPPCSPSMRSALSQPTSIAADVNRRETCDRIGRLVVEQGSPFMTWQLGFSIGRRVGWPAERLRSLESERDRYIHLGSRPRPGPTRLVDSELGDSADLCPGHSRAGRTR